MSSQESETDPQVISSTQRSSDPRSEVEHHVNGSPQFFVSNQSPFHAISGVEQGFEPNVVDNMHGSGIWQPFHQGQIQEASYGTQMHNYHLIPQIVGVPMSGQPYYDIGNGQHHFLSSNELGHPVIMIPVSPITSNAARRQNRRHRGTVSSYPPLSESMNTTSPGATAISDYSACLALVALVEDDYGKDR